MLWPHDDRFPFRRTALLVVTGVGTVACLLWPQLAALERLVAACAVILVTAISYGVFFLFLRLAALLGPSWLFVCYGYFTFYSAVFAALVTPFGIADVLGDPDSYGLTTPLMIATVVSSSVPTTLAIAAAAYNVMARERSDG